MRAATVGARTRTTARGFRAVALAASVVVLAACAPVAGPSAAHAPRVWPDPPDPPRIELVDVLARPADFGISNTLWQRVSEFLFGASDVQLIRPMAVLDVDGVVFVADPGVKGVHRFDARAGTYDLVQGPGASLLPSPVGLARGDGGTVYVTDSVLARVLRIAPQAKAAEPLELPAMRQPTGIAYDTGTGRLFVVDTTAHRVNVYERDGRLGATFGQRGTGPGEFNYPTQLWRDARGRLFVTDSLNYRIQILDAQGRPLGRFGQAGDATGDFMRHKGVATDRHGHVYVIDALIGAIQIFDDAGQLLLTVGELGSERGEFWLPTGIYVGTDDTIWVADSYNQRVQKFRYLGGPP